MNRLPIKFEEEELNEHSIYWEKWNTYEGYVKSSNYLTGESYNVTPYEITGIGLEILMTDYFINISKINNYDNWDIWVMSKDEKNRSLVFYGFDKDFCECVFKAINQIYK